MTAVEDASLNLLLRIADVGTVRVTPDYVEPRRAWWLSFWFAVLIIVAVVGAIAYEAYLLAPAITGDLA